ncbi:hypothetical protein [Faecalicatena orotica]|uniref:hypothetical protein n=1 Tax=Faecalicatena orotica TaxID=1544 RepID=UPI003216C1C2
MRKNVRKSLAFLLTLLMAIGSLGLNVFAADSTSNNEGAIHRLGYEIYDYHL